MLGTVRDNFLYANMNAKDEDIESALQKANATFIKTIDKGLDSEVNSLAIQNLSGG